MDRALDIAIVGYGTAGQAAALFLSRMGHRLRIFERSPVLGPIGAGVLIQPTGMAVLADLGLLEQALACGAPVHRLYGANLAGHAVMDMRYRNLHPDYFGLGLQRGALFALLRSAFCDNAAISTGVEIVRLSADGRSLLDVSGQQHGPFDLIVAADGAASALRTSVAPRGRDRPYPWGALWCLCPDVARDFDGQLSQRYDKARRMSGVLPVGCLPGESSDRHRVSFFWSMPLAAMTQWQHDGIDAWKRQLHDYWPQAAGLLDHIVRPEQLARASYRDVVLHRLHRDRVVWLGDSAHAMSPQLGQGANMALLDAQALAQQLLVANDVPSALAAYDRARRKHVGIYQFISRWLTPLFQSDHDLVARVRDLAFEPFGRAPGLRGSMLKVLAGIQSGWFGRFRFEHDPRRLRERASDTIQRLDEIQ